MGKGANTEQVVREIHRRTRRRFSPEEKVRVHMWCPPRFRTPQAANLSRYSFGV